MEQKRREDPCGRKEDAYIRERKGTGGRYRRGRKRRVTERAYAKINLSLDVTGKRENGYHDVEMVMQAVGLYDKVTVEWEPMAGRAAQSRVAADPVPEQIVEAVSNLPYLPVNENNIACKAARLMIRIYKPGESLRIKINMEKHIPVGAGLAGGSADGAAVLRALSRLWHLNLNLSELCSLGEQLGADVPFCLWAQEGLTCALGRGLGEELSSLPPLDSWVLMVKPPFSVSTAKVYAALDMEALAPESRPDTENVMAGLAGADVKMLAASMKNVLETVTLVQFPRAAKLKADMLQIGGADAVLMSGSGPTIFGLYRDEKAARRAYAILRAQYRETYLRRTCLE